MALVAVSVMVVAQGCDSCGDARGVPVQVGQTVEGALTEEDMTDVFADGSRTDLYKVRLEAGQRVTLEMESSAFDTYLSLMRGPGDQIVDNDDITPGENTNSRFTHTIQATGWYYIAATSYRPDARGSYRLRITEAGDGGETSLKAPASGSAADASD